MNRRFRILAGLLGAVAVGLLLVALWVAGRQPHRRQRLPDGSMLELLAVTFSTNISYRSPQPNALESAAQRVLPTWLAHRIGLFHPAGAITMGSRIGETNLAIFTGCGEVIPNYFSDASLEAADENGNAIALVEGKGTLSAGSGSGLGSRIDAWVLSAFPRRGKTIELRFLRPYPKTHRAVQVASFTIPNPCPPPYPTWTPEPLPTTKRAEDLAVTLTRFVTRPNAAPSTPTASPVQASRLEMLFGLEQAGVTEPAWEPKSVEFTDATGNHWVPWPDRLRAFQEGGLCGLSVEGGLWPGEAAWKMRVEFSRTNHFNPEELWTVSGVPVPAANELITLGAATNLAGARLQLIAITGPQAEQPGNLKWGIVKGMVNLSIRVMPLPEDHRLTLVSGMDAQNGRSVKVTPAYEGRSSEMLYGLGLPDGARELQITFALHRSRFSEFLASPTQERGTAR